MDGPKFSLEKIDGSENNKKKVHAGVDFLDVLNGNVERNITDRLSNEQKILLDKYHASAGDVEVLLEKKPEGPEKMILLLESAQLNMPEGPAKYLALSNLLNLKSFWRNENTTAERSEALEEAERLLKDSEIPLKSKTEELELKNTENDGTLVYGDKND